MLLFLLAMAPKMVSTTGWRKTLLGLTGVRKDVCTPETLGVWQEPRCSLGKLLSFKNWGELLCRSNATNC
ncbi:hypothetical protein Hdeb2414_s0008g00271731 [Helianthus debilis subsp. tardiflorus]